jgi:tetratricopeptide (TPR) repeat protein
MTNCGESDHQLHAKAANHLEQGEFDQAKNIYKNIISSNPYDIDAIQGMVDSTKHQQDTDEHYRWCRRLIQFRPWNRYSNIVVGKYLLSKGNKRDAINRFIMADQDADFANEKIEIIQLLKQVNEQLAKEYKERLQELHDRKVQQDINQ